MSRDQFRPFVVGFYEPEPLIQCCDLHFLAEKLKAQGQQAQHDRLGIILREKRDQLFSPRNQGVEERSHVFGRRLVHKVLCPERLRLVPRDGARWWVVPGAFVNVPHPHRAVPHLLGGDVPRIQPGQQLAAQLAAVVLRQPALVDFA